MDSKKKYLKYKKKYLQLKAQMGGRVNKKLKDSSEMGGDVSPNDDVKKTTQGFLDIKDMVAVRSVDKTNYENVKPEDCINSCKCVDLKPTGKIPECEGACNQYCKMHTNESIRIAVKEWFENEENATQKYGHISTWDTSRVTDMSYMFNNKSEFNQPLNDWKVGNVENMKAMFKGASKFNQPLNNWNVSKVENMTHMFYGASQFNQSLNAWDVNNVKYAINMFYDLRADSMDETNKPSFPATTEIITRNLRTSFIKYRYNQYKKK
jgi:surface protein